MPAIPAPDQDLLVLHQALIRLESLDARAGRVVELRFFGGLNEEEVAEILGVSRKTVQRDWKTARAWLVSHLAPQEKGKSDLPPKREQRSTKLAVSADGDKALSVGGQDPLEEKGEFTRVSRERHTDSCNNSTLHGRYLFQTFGFGFDPSLGFQSLDAYPFDSAGIVVADDGNFSFHDWANFGATFARRNYPALYDLNPDCTGILRQPDPTFPTAVILSAGKGEAFVLIQRETAAPVVGFFQRQ
jgi:predicted DNA-binding protein (UPF0251 family)